MANFYVTFDDRSEAHFTSGETVSGVFHFENEKERKIEYISIKFIGKAAVLKSFEIKNNFE
jgi:uncharacterized protein YqfB (UPF0267 family)